MSETITVQPLTLARREDYMRFFDNDAFTDNPHWASCYCHFNQAPHPDRGRSLPQRSQPLEAHAVAASSAASIQAVAAASASASADLTTTSTRLPSGEKLG